MNTFNAFRNKMTYDFKQTNQAKDSVGILPDHTYPSAKGCEHVSRLIADFLKSDPTTRSWYLKRAE